MTHGKPSSRGSALAALIFALFLMAMTVSTVYFFVARTWWFPESVTSLGHQVDSQFIRTLIITGIVFVLAQVFLGLLTFRYRDRGRGDRATYSHGNNTLEILWTSAAFILFVGLGVAAENAWTTYHARPTTPPDLVVEVTGQQFQWNIRYPGPDGAFGRTDPAQVNDAAGNFLGLDPTDSAGQDDLVLPVMAVPVNRDVEVVLKSKDVTHSFFVRELRFKQDTTPGLEIHMRFRAEKTGVYEVVCAELCGLGHHRMRTTLTVMTDEEFQAWLVEQAEF